jgi:two-component system CheB/CheR fusion protein
MEAVRRSIVSGRAEAEVTTRERTGRRSFIVDRSGADKAAMSAKPTEEGVALLAAMIAEQADRAASIATTKAISFDLVEKLTTHHGLLSHIEQAFGQSPNRDTKSPQAAAAIGVSCLTRRQREVFDLVVSGHTNPQIAARLGVSQRTVETHRALVMNKMGARSLVELVRLADLSILRR